MPALVLAQNAYLSPITRPTLALQARSESRAFATRSCEDTRASSRRHSTCRRRRPITRLRINLGSTPAAYLDIKKRPCLAVSREQLLGFCLAFAINLTPNNGNNFHGSGAYGLMVDVSNQKVTLAYSFSILEEVQDCRLRSLPGVMVTLFCLQN